ncbi:MAG: GNAT family N-acetyltransferase [Bacteroidetes bacterium]|nr:GNAT family N-acetyltransferase [Bacteroidota bacterium]
MTMETPSPYISQITPSEVGLLTALARTTFEETYGGRTNPLDLQCYLDAHLTLDRFRAELAAPESTFHLAYIGAEPAGYLKLRRDRLPKGLPSGWPCLQVERIYVLRRFQGAGLGSTLLSLAIEEARAAGHKTVWLQVWQQNPEAIGFYRSRGFEIFETAHFVLGDQTTEDYLMRFDIQD